MELLEGKAKMGKEDQDKDFVKALIGFEASGVLSKSIQANLFKSDKILIQK